MTIQAQLTDEQRAEMLQRIVTVTAEIRKIAELVAPAVIKAVAELKQAMDGLREAGLLDDDYKPITAADRPAWQSPYGPPPRR
jgi:predicted deacylase